MKKILLLLAFIVAGSSSSFAVINMKWQQMAQNDAKLQQLPPEMLQMGLANFLTITPQQYKAKTGKRLGIFKSVKLKMAQKYVKNNLMGDDSGITSGIYILLAILGLGWVAMGILDDWSGQNWVVNLILSFLCWLPGLIHALVKKSEYF